MQIADTLPASSDLYATNSDMVFRFGFIPTSGYISFKGCSESKLCVNCIFMSFDFFKKSRERDGEREGEGGREVVATGGSQVER